MQKINNDLRKLCASLEGQVAARLDGEYERYDSLERQRLELLPKVQAAEAAFAKAKATNDKSSPAIATLRAAHAEMITLEDQLAEVEHELVKLKMLVFDTRLVVLNEIREKVNLLAQLYFDELTAITRLGEKVVADARQVKGISKAPITVTVKSLPELEALLYSPYIRKAETLQLLREIIRSYQEYELGTIVVRIHDNREGVPGIRWKYPDDKNIDRGEG